MIQDSDLTDRSNRSPGIFAARSTSSNSPSTLQVPAPANETSSLPLTEDANMATLTSTGATIMELVRSRRAKLLTKSVLLVTW
jgi:hypothetical protein